MGRPLKEIDETKVKKLAGMGLTVEEIAVVMDCDKKTLERRFVALIKDGRQHLNSSLKRRQFSVAMKGNVAMLIWLGKQYLGQSDKLETKNEHRHDGGSDDMGILRQLTATLRDRRGAAGTSEDSGEAVASGLRNGSESGPVGDATTSGTSE